MSRRRSDQPYVSCQIYEYDRLYYRKTKTLLMNQFSIDGVDYENGVNDIAVSYFLYKFGNVCFFFDDVIGRLEALPCNIEKWDIYNNPTIVTVYSPFTEFNRKLRASTDQFYVCFDTTMRMRSKDFLRPWISQLSNLSVSIDVNMFVQRTPLLTLSNLDERLTMENIVNSYMSGTPLIELKRNKSNAQIDDISKAISVFKLEAPYLIDKLEIERRKVWNNVLETIGYKCNVNDTKKERLITDEVQSNLEETAGFYESRKKPRLKAVEWLNKHGIYAELREITNTKITLDSEEESILNADRG